MKGVISMVIKKLNPGEEAEMSTSKYMKAFGKRLTAARIAAGYDTAASFAKALGVDAYRYRHYERGNASPSYEVLKKICDLTKKDSTYFI
jgi:predicted transcriptional regulator